MDLRVTGKPEVRWIDHPDERRRLSALLMVAWALEDCANQIAELRAEA